MGFYHRHFWRYFGALLGEIARIRTTRTTQKKLRRGLPGQPHFLQGFRGRWRHNSSLRSDCPPFPIGTLAAQTTGGASRWSSYEP